MAEKKTSSKSKAQSNAELAEQLRLAAEILDGESGQPAEKKPAAKKPAAKKPASKAPAKKPTTKKPATKAAPKKAEATPDETVEHPAEEEPKTVAPVVEEPTEQPVQPTAETSAEAVPQRKFGNRRSDCVKCGAENDKNAVVCAVCGAQLRPLPNAESQAPVQPAPAPVVEQKEQPAPVAEEQPEQKAEEKAEEKVEKPAPVTEPAEQKPEQPAPAATRGKKSDAFMGKSKDFIDNKGKLPLFIVANSLLFLSFLFLFIGAFNISTAYGKNIYGNLFTYYSNAAAIKFYWQATAGEWANGGYVMMGILMTFACLVPLALVVKNIVFFILKKDKNVHMLDAIITFAFIIAYLGVVNMYGANMTWSHILVLIMSIVLLAYTIFVILLENREGPFPFFSIANLLMVMLCMFLLTSNKIYAAPGYYAAHAAGYSVGGGFAFIMLLVGLAALVLLIVMQVKKLPGKIAWLFEFLVPAVAGVCALIALISFAAGKPAGIGMGGGFVFGVVLTLLFAAADVVFALVPQLHKFNVKVTDRMSAAQPAPAVAQPVAQPAEQSAPAQEPAPATEPAPAAEKPASEPVKQTDAVGGNVYCPSCGTQNGVDDMYCMKCGRKLK